ncbi:MAG: HAD-IC family P-type ATPase [Solobacterium sp.]|nr:HAD-IC family P-type ATPase [Solobacterium sp.]
MSKKGLSTSEINQRIQENKVNGESKKLSKSTINIIKENIFTYFNFLNVILFIFVFTTGKYQNAMFMGAVITNALIGIIQEIRAKKLLDQIRILTTTKVNAFRDNAWVEISVDEIVQDDVLRLQSGIQIPIDGVITEGSLEINESLLTGESDTVYKKVGDTVYSGTIVLSGDAEVSVTKVGRDRQSEKIMEGTKISGFQKSALQKDLQKLIKIVSVLIIPVALILVIMQMGVKGVGYSAIVLNTSAAIIGMIPEGLVVLTSVALAVSTMRLLKLKALVQELYSIEGLARVDVVCLDKTGTLTQGDMQVDHIEIVGDISELNLHAYMHAYLEMEKHPNPTAKALIEYFKSDTKIQVDDFQPFVSERKYTSASLHDIGTLYVGAFEFIFNKKDAVYQTYHDTISQGELRTIAIALAKEEDRKELLSLVYIRDIMRPNVNETLAYLSKQGVTIKVISGDYSKTVSSIARKAGVPNADKYIDLSVGEIDYNQVVEEYTVFGRVLPKQKKELLTALQRKHVVAMVGDGVNDVPALRQADVSIAMLAGSSAAKDISDIVLLENDFNVVPSIVCEGRRVINNISRASSMYLVKTLFSFFLTIYVALFQTVYPFVPVHLTMISAICVGIPTVFLQLEPSFERLKGRFLVDAFLRALPSAITVVLVVVFMKVYRTAMDLPLQNANAILVFVTGVIYLYTLYRIYQPTTKYRLTIVFVMSFLFVITYYFTQNILGISFSIELLPVTLLTSVIGVAIVSLLGFFTDKAFKINSCNLK